MLVVRVAEPAEGGRATKAALRLLAEALTLPHRSVTLVHGATSRHKVVDIDCHSRGAESVRVALQELRTVAGP